MRPGRGRRVYKKMATAVGGGAVGGLTATIATAKIGPGFKSPKPGYNFFLANLANFYESLKRGAKDRNPLANNNFPANVARNVALLPWSIV